MSKANRMANIVTKLKTEFWVDLASLFYSTAEKNISNNRCLTYLVFPNEMMHSNNKLWQVQQKWTGKMEKRREKKNSIKYDFFSRKRVGIRVMSVWKNNWIIYRTSVNAVCRLEVQMRFETQITTRRFSIESHSNRELLTD